MKNVIITLSAFVFLISDTYSQAQSLYNFDWLDKDEQVYVLQNKEFVKKSRFAIDLGLIQSDNSPYYDSTGFFFTGTYHFSDRYSIDLTHKRYANSESQDLKNLLSLSDLQTKPLLNVIDAVTFINFNWIPFYGKLNIFNNIYYFDLGFGVGGGMFNVQSNYKTFSEKNKPFTLDKETATGANTKIFFKFFTDKNFTFGFNYNLSMVQTIKSADEQKQNYFYSDFLINVGYLF